MKSVRIRLALVFLLAWCMALPAAPEAGKASETEETVYELGDSIEDVAFTAIDGTDYLLSDVLKEKDAVLLNFWATWCGPCKMEFPYMEAAYEEYQDSIEIFALSCEADDTNEILADYAEENGMTFPVGRDEEGLYKRFAVSGIPTSVMVDRFGKICLIEVGSQPSADNFRRLFDVFLGDDYTESVLLEEIPAGKPDIDPVDAQILTEELNVEGGKLVCENPQDEYNWPVVLSEEEEGGCMTSNAGVGNSVSSLNIFVDAKAGEVFAVDYRLSSESAYDFMTISVDGTVVKRCSGEKDWRTYACAFEEDGEHTVTIAYEKDEAEDGGEDVLFFDGIRLLDGEEAEEALAAMPVYPSGEETALSVANPDAREIVFDDSTGILTNTFGDDAAYYIIPGDEAEISITIAEGTDPEGAVVDCYYDGTRLVLEDCLDGEEYLVQSGIDSVETTGYSYCYVALTAGDEEPVRYLVYFNSEKDVERFLANNFSGDDGEVLASWKYADSELPPKETGDTGDDTSEYRLVFTDQNGDPVQGVIANICDDSSCEPMVSDENGVVAFTKPAFAYHIQILKVPEGYEYNMDEDSYLEEGGGETAFTVTKK